MAVKEAAHYVDENDWSHRTPFAIFDMPNEPQWHLGYPGEDHPEIIKDIMFNDANPQIRRFITENPDTNVSQGEIAHGALGEPFLEAHGPGDWIDRPEWPQLEKDIKAKYLENWNRNPVKDVRFYREAMINNAIEEAMTQFKVASKNPSKFHTTTEEHLKSLKKRGPLKTHQKHRKSWSEADRWVECNQGHTHWGANGAAGLLIRHTDPQGVNRYLLQHRGGDVQDAGTWSIPGGALDYGESPEQGALREAQEELGPFNAKIQGVHHVNDHGNWAYHTVAAQAPEMFHPAGDQWEHGNHAWVTPQEMQQLPLHPGFAEFMNHGTLSSVKVSAIDPLDLQNHIAVHGPYLYHSTAPENVRNILRDGILPKEQTGVDYYGNHQPELSSRPDHAYIGEPSVTANHLGAVLKVDLRKLDPSLINCDEDYMQFKPKMTVQHPSELPGYEGLPAWSEERARQYHKFDQNAIYPSLGQFAEQHQHIIDQPEWVKNSLGNGSVAVRGGVPADAISLNDTLLDHPFDLYEKNPGLMSPFDFYNNDPNTLKRLYNDPAELKKLQEEFQRRDALGLGQLSSVQHPGAMVALFIPDAEAKKLHIEGGEDADQLHITLAFFEDEGADRDDWDEAVKIIKRIAEEFPPLEGEITGTGRFQTDDSEPFIGLVSIHGINALHDKLTIALSDAGFDISTKFAYNPHITLKYEDAGDPDPPFDADLPMKIRFEKMTLTVAGERTEVDFNSKASVDLSQPILASRNDNTRAEKSRLSKFASFGCRNCGGQEFGMAGQCRECKKFTFTAALTFAEEETPDMLSGGKAYKYLYAVQDGQKVGFIHFIVDKAGNGKIIKIEVPPEYQRQGIGTALFTELSREYPGVQHSNDLTDAGAAWKQSLGAEKDPDYLFAYYNTGLKVEEWHHNLRYRNILEDLLHEYESDIDYTGWEDNENLWTGGEIYESPFRIEFKQLSLPEVQEAAEAAIREYFDKKQLEEYEKYIAPQWLENLNDKESSWFDQSPYPYRATPDPDYVYHVAPSTDRARINAHGLIPASPGINPYWGEGQFTGQPVGVYAFENKNQAEEAPNYYFDGEEERPFDVWKIPRSQIKDWQQDPATSTAIVIKHSVQPEMHLPHEERIMRPQWDEFPDELERKEMGIGWPDRVIGKTAGLSYKRLTEMRDQWPHPDTSKAVHTFPDGWTINQPQTHADAYREGTLMGNCWGMNDKTFADSRLSDYELEHDGKGMNLYTLRDPESIPHAMWSEFEDDDSDPGNRMFPDLEGRHGSQLKPKYLDYLKSYYGPQDTTLQSYYEPWEGWTPQHEQDEQREQGDNYIGPLADKVVKTAASQVMYHVAPTSARESIQQDGLRIPSKPHEMFPELPYQHIWLWPDRATYDDMQKKLYVNGAGEPLQGWDTWEADVTGHNIAPDPHNWQGAVTTDKPIGPERLRLMNPPEKFTVPGQQLPFPGISAKVAMPTDPAVISQLQYRLSQPSWGGYVLEAYINNNKVGEVAVDSDGVISSINSWMPRKGIATDMLNELDKRGIRWEHSTSFSDSGKDLYDSLHPNEDTKWTPDTWNGGGWERITMALTPTQWENWKRETGGKLYHYTNPENVDKILQEGIRPWDDVGYSMYENPANRDLLPRPGHTYMTTYPRESYYFDKDFKEGWHKPIFEIDMNKLDPQMVNMDEDHAKYYMDSEHPAWEPYWNTQDNPDKSLGGIIQEHKDYFDKPIMVNNSLQHGSIAYQGKIPPEAIKLHRPATKMSSTWF